MSCVMAMRISLDCAAACLPMPELAALCLPSEIDLRTENKKLEELAPQLEHLIIEATLQKNIQTGPTLDQAIRGMIHKDDPAPTAFYSPFSNVWRERIERRDAERMEIVVKKLEFCQGKLHPSPPL